MTMIPASRRSTRPAAVILAALVASFLPLASGCGKPSAANITLRREIQSLEQQVDQLQRQHAADQASLRAMQSEHGTLETLPPERLGQLFTVAGIKIGRLTGGIDLDRENPGDEELRVYLTPLDATGDELKAAGSIVVELFDLAAEQPRLGRWEFDVEQAKRAWVGTGLLYEYLLSCPWQTVPTRESLTVKVTFTDALTGRVFEQQQAVTINPPTP